MRPIHFLFLAVMLLWSLSGCHKSQKAAEQPELISSYDLDPADIIAYDEEESAPHNGVSLIGDYPVVTSKNDTVPLASILSPGMVVARYSLHACGDCVAHLNQAIIRYAETYPDSTVIVILRNSHPRDLHVYHRELGDGKIRFFLADSLPGDFDECITPYLYRVGENMTIQGHFIPRKEIPDRVLHYLDLPVDN